MKTQVRQLATKSKIGIISLEIYNNWRMKRRFNAGNIETSSGTVHSNLTLQESLSYINHCFDDYLNYSDISIDKLRDKRILEIGPGDNIGVAIRFLIAGAKQVVCLDKFISKNDWEQQRKIYQTLREQLNESEKQIFDEIIDLENGIQSDSQKLSCFHGTGIEEAEKLFEPKSFDLIVSRAVCEHLYDPNAAFSVMNRLLKPGGFLLHKIDFRDHGMFSSHKYHPLTFLTIPRRVYRLMTNESGKPNRKLLTFYRQKVAELGLDAKMLITHIVGWGSEVLPHKETVRLGVDYSGSTISLLNSIRPHLQAEFRNMSDEELMVAGVFLVARKPFNE